MRATRWAWLAAFVAAFVFVPEASAHMPWHKKPIKKMTAKQQYVYGLYAVRHGKAEAHDARRTLRWFKKNRARTLGSGNPAVAVESSRSYRKELVRFRDHRWLYRYGKGLMARAQARMRPVLYIPTWAVNGFSCIHRYEGSWRDTGDPYWGGLQMDRDFMAAYAPAWLLRRGFAHTWSPREQMWVGYQALRAGRGWHPWPNTARMCGLL
jgi:hypothetical protein